MTSMFSMSSTAKPIKIYKTERYKGETPREMAIKNGEVKHEGMIKER